MNGERRTHERRTTARGARSTFVVRAFVVARRSFAVLRSSFWRPPRNPSSRPDSSELVVLPVVVTDKQGRYISDLPGDRFTVFDNGRRVPIELFTNEDTPVTVGLIIDASGSMRPKIGEVLAASLAIRALEQPAGRAVRGPLQRRRAGRDARCRRFCSPSDLAGARGGGQRPFAPTAGRRSTTG